MISAPPIRILGIDAERPADQAEHDHSADAEPAAPDRNSDAAAAETAAFAVVLDIVAAAKIIPTHGPLLYPGLWPNYCRLANWRPCQAISATTLARLLRHAYYSAGIGVAGAVGALAAGDWVAGPLSTRSSMAIRNAMPKPSTSAQAMNTKRNATFKA